MVVSSPMKTKGGSISALRFAQGAPAGVPDEVSIVPG
jgi:hypothetical protein